MRTIIVDDERLAREAFKQLLEKYEDIEIVGEYKNAKEAEAGILELNPDLLFIDIQMPGETGLDLIERMENPPRTVFVTAYDEFAIKAFELNAYDYLLKPLEDERLSDVIHRIYEEYKTPESVETSKLLKSGDKLLIKDGEKVWFISIDEIRYFESDGNYVKVFFKNFHPLILRSLNSLADRIDEQLFFRANRKYLVNLNRIVNMETWFNGSFQIEMDCGTKIDVSRRQAIKFKDQFSL
ncbi:DNA-binding response regulator [Putridiphycobacter roseus]|uniref:DNA-binding response regulator n=1 Tax=Putridiphycobacter roseus TaxID=2219161 RepID=A0A2W1NVV9_9FLAO|nr:DNA-binding response regulator [Putridiphycobacter roseus]